MKTLEGLLGNQKVAVEQLEQTIAVSAGAGSGKTRVLVKRFISLLISNLAELEEIAAITFTNKAAVEMKQRIRQELQLLIAEAGEEGKNSPEKIALEKIVRRIDGAQISTVHSFCANVLRSYPLEAGIDPGAELLESAESELLLEECLHNLLDEAVKKGEDWAINLFLEYGNSSSFFSDLIYIVQRIRMSGKDLKELSLVERTSQESFNETIKQQIAFIDELLGEIDLEDEKITAKSKEKVDAFSSVWQQYKPVLLTCLEDESSFPCLAELNRVLNLNVSKKVKIYLQQIKGVLKSLEDGFADRREVSVKSWLFTFLIKLEQSYSWQKEKMSVLDFTDLEILTLKLLRTHPRIVEELSRKYKYLLVDEVQDINPVQEELIYYLICALKDDCLQPGKLFAVGDEKQSIYRFRGADVRVFSRLKGKINNNEGLNLDLETNFRSKKGLVEFFNYLFSRLMLSFDQQSARVDYEAGYRSVNWIRDDDGCPSVELLAVVSGQGKNLSISEAREREAALIAERIRKMVEEKEKLIAEENGFRTVNYGDIAILLRSATDLSLYEVELREREIPYLTSMGRGFYTRQEISDLINFMRVLLDE